MCPSPVSMPEVTSNPIHPRRGQIDLSPGVQIGEVALDLARTLDRIDVGAKLNEIARDKARGEPEMAKVLFDFRMDFLAYCLYGVWACTVIHSQLFLHRYWSLGCGLIAAFLVLNRFVTVTYLLGVSAGFALICGTVAIFWRKEADLVSRLRRRLFNLGLSTVVLLVVVLPILIRNRHAIHDYYVVNHVVGEERYVRAALLGIHDLAGHLSFYPNSIIQDHLGGIFLWASAIVIGCGLATRLLGRKSREEVTTRHDETFLLANHFLDWSCPGPACCADRRHLKVRCSWRDRRCAGSPASCRSRGDRRTQAISTGVLLGSQTLGRIRSHGIYIGTVQPTPPSQPALARLRSSRRPQAIGRTRQISDRSRQSIWMESSRGFLRRNYGLAQRWVSDHHRF